MQESATSNAPDSEQQGHDNGISYSHTHTHTHSSHNYIEHLLVDWFSRCWTGSPAGLVPLITIGCHGAEDQLVGTLLAPQFLYDVAEFQDRS